MIELTINSLRQVTPNITEQIYVGDTLEDITVRLPSSIAGKNIEEFEIKMRAYVDDETYFEYPIPTDKSSIDIDVGLALTDEVRNLKVLFVCTHASGEVGKTNFVVLKVEQSPDGTALSHTIEITENGEYDVTKYTEANVDVPEGITVNESYDISEGTLNSATITLEGGVVATIPDGVITLGRESFTKNAVITKVIMPNSVTAIANGIPWSGGSCFESCANLKEVIFSINLISIGDYAFSGCTSLTELTLPDSLTSIGTYAFYNCTSLTGITIPDSVTSIGEGAFSGCTSLTGITIPDNVTSIGKYAFRNCTGLISATIPDSVTSIEESTFSSCASLPSITIPDSIISIGADAFSDCTSLSSITIPDSVTSIGPRAFRACTSLSSITIHDSITSIGKKTFEDCTSLTDIYYTGTQAQWEQITIGTGAIPAGATIHYEYTP